MPEKLNTIAGPGWEDIPGQEAELPNPPEQEEKPKTEEEIKNETLNARKGPASQFLEELRDDTNSDLEQDRKKLKSLTGKRKSSKEARIGILETRIRDAETALEPLNERGEIEPAVNFIQKAISEHADSFREGHTLVFAPIDKKFFEYIRGTVEAISSKAGTGVVLSEREIEIFEDYLKTVKEKTNKKSEADILKEKIEALRTQGVAESETVAISSDVEPTQIKPEAPVIPVPERKPVQADTETKPEAETPPEFNEFSFISESTKGLVDGLLGKKIEAGETPKILLGLNEKKKKIEAQLSVETDENIKKELLAKKRTICEGIIEIASERDGKDIREEIKGEEQKQLEISIAASGFKSMENYERTMRDRYYNEIILGSNLSGEQRKALIKDGEIVVSNWPSSIILGKEEVATCIRMGTDVFKTKRAGFLPGFSKKIVTIDKIIDKKTGKEGRGPVGYKDIGGFERRLKTSPERASMEEEIKQKIEQRKKEIIDKGITDFVLNKKVSEIVAPLEEEEANKKWESSAPEFSENPDETASLKIETPEDQLEKLNQLRYGWEQANRLFRALKENKKINIGGGEILNPENEEERKKIEEEMAVFSEEIIRVANEISGRSLRREFWQNKFKEGEIVAEKPTDFEKEEFRPEFRKWLTIEVQKIYKTSIKELKDVKKIALKNTRSPEKVLRELGKNLPNEKEYVSKNLEEEKKDVIDKYMREFLHKTNFSSDVLRYLTDNQNVITEDALAFALESGYDIEELRNAMVSRKWIVAGKGKVKIGEKSVDQKELQKQFENAKKKFSRRVLNEAIKRLKFDYSTGNLKK